MEAMEEISRSRSESSASTGSPAQRLEYALQLLDARASGYVKLVSDIATQEAFVTILSEFMFEAFEECSGFAGVEPLPGNLQFRDIEERSRHWIKESYRRLIPATEGTAPLGSNKDYGQTSRNPRSSIGDRSPTVFISYSQDTEPPDHCDQVHKLAEQLRTEGVDVMIDHYDSHPKEGWPRWMLRQIRESDFVLCVCTAAYSDRFEARTQAEVGKGARFEGYIITNEIYQKACDQGKFIPLLFEHAGLQDIPSVLQSLTHYKLPNSFDQLYARLTTQPVRVKPPLGKIRKVKTPNWVCA
jgi:hypothetical protein